MVGSKQVGQLIRVAEHFGHLLVVMHGRRVNVMFEEYIEFERAAGRVDELGEFFIGVGAFAAELEAVVGEELQQRRGGDLVG